MSERWIRAILAGFGVAAIAVVIRIALGPGELVSDGRPLHAWVDQLREPDCGDAESVLSRLGPEVVPLLLQQVRTGRDSSQGNARPGCNGEAELRHGRLVFRVESIFRMIGPEAVPELLAALEHEDARVRLVAARAIGTIWPAVEITLPAMLNRLNDPDCQVRDTAVTLLTRMRHCRDSVIPALVGILNTTGSRGQDHASCRVAIHATAALGQMGACAKSAEPELRRLLTHPDRALQQEAAIALCRINGDLDTLALLTTAPGE